MSHPMDSHVAEFIDLLNGYELRIARWGMREEDKQELDKRLNKFKERKYIQTGEVYEKNFVIRDASSHKPVLCGPDGEEIILVSPTFAKKTARFLLRKYRRDVHLFQNVRFQ